MGFLGCSVVKYPSANAGDVSLILGREVPLEKEMATTPVFLPRKHHRQRSLVGYSPRGRKNVRHDRATEKQQT